MRFQLNDHVRVKPGVLLQETGEPVPGWVGQITEVPADTAAQIYLIELDAFSLEQLPEKYLADCIEHEEIGTSYYFREDDLEPAARRDTDEQRTAAQERLENITNPLEEDDLDRATVSEWIGAFEQSPLYAALTPEAQESANVIIETFAEYAFNYPGYQPDDWTVATIREVCLELIPRKFTAEIEFFELVGTVLNQFFGFLAESNRQKNAAAMHREIKKIAPEIVRNAKDPRNWGMAKGIMMQAMGTGVDLSDEHAISDFMASYSANMARHAGLPEPGPKKQSLLRPASGNPFVNIARNETVRVKYPDGSIRDGKFKRLEDDLRAGKCELVR
ncbi:MAG: hypothetical protein ABMA02_04290 [Saprospiraceae bacterium]